ncbi:MAG: hypothetical protein MJY56_05565 [Bacteroidales bacterium]|nr:hypothetical protein [Bacteroidales bacterium]
MKRFAIVLAALLTVATVSNAQIKSAAQAQKAVTSASTAANNPKKAAKVATWVKLGNAYIDAYNSPRLSGWIGASKTDLSILMSGVNPTSVEQVELGGSVYEKNVYPTCNYYFGPNGLLSLVETTKPVVEDALDKALEAYAKGAEVDLKHQKTKDLTNGINSINDKYMELAMNAYTFGDFATSSLCFEKAAAAKATAPVSQIDTVAIYNAAYTAYAAGNNDRALEFFNKCYELGYYYEDGEVFAKLADLYVAKGDTEKQVALLEEGFTKYPGSQAILIGLINYYIENSGNTARLFELLDVAKKNEPDNASLYYVEGNIHKQLGENDAPLASYAEASNVNPAYEFGYIGAGILHYEEAIAISEKAATEFDDNKYMAMVAQFEQELLDAIDPFEKAFNACKDDSIKVNIAEYLKNIYYRFYDKGADYEAGYKKYDKIVKEGL